MFSRTCPFCRRSPSFPLNTMNNPTPKDVHPRPTLQSLFSAERVEFHNRLTGARSPTDAATCIDDLLTELHHNFLGLLPVPTARFFNQCFALKDLSPVLLKAAAKSSYSVEPSPDSPTTEPLPKAQLIATFTKAIVAIVALLAVVHVSLTGTVFLCLLLFLLGLEIFGLLVARWEALIAKLPPLFWVMIGLPAPRKKADAKKAFNVKATLQVDAAIVCDALMEAFANVDRAIADREASHMPTEPVPLTGFPLVLDLLQQLVSVDIQRNSAGALCVASTARGVLLNYQITAHVFKSETDRTSDWFIPGPALTPEISEYTTELVALTSGDTLVRRGRVIEPYKS